MQTLNINAQETIALNLAELKAALNSDGVIIQEKIGGTRYHLVITPGADLNGRPTGRAQILMRNHKIVPALASLFSTESEKLALGAYLADCMYPEGIVIDGEIAVKGMTLASSNNELLKRVQLKPARLNMYVFGVLELSQLVKDPNAPLPTSNLMMEELADRELVNLKEYIGAFTWLRPKADLVYSLEELITLYEYIRTERGPTITLKSASDTVKRGAASGWWDVTEEDIASIMQEIK